LTLTETFNIVIFRFYDRYPADVVRAEYEADAFIAIFTNEVNIDTNKSKYATTLILVYIM